MSDARRTATTVRFPAGARRDAADAADAAQPAPAAPRAATAAAARVGSKRIYFTRGPAGRVGANPMTSRQYEAERRAERSRRPKKKKITVERARRLLGMRRAATRRLRTTGPSDAYVARVRAHQRISRVIAKNPKRRSRPMAKLHGAAKAAFLSRMARGRARARNPASLRRSTQHGPNVAPQLYEDHRWLSAEARRKNPMTARNHSGQFVSVANPGRPFSQVPRSYGKGWGKPKRKRAKARRSPTKKKVHARRRKSPARSTALVQKGSGRGHRRYPYQVTFRTPNPPKKRRRRARNPSFGGVISSIKSAALPMALGGVAGLGAGYVDAKWLGDKPTISILMKIGAAVLGAAAIGRKHPMGAAGWAGGLIGSTGYHAGVHFGGGMVGLSPASALKGIADMAADDPDMAAMIAGLGQVVDEDGNVLGDAADDYNAALADSDAEMADLVEDAA